MCKSPLFAYQNKNWYQLIDGEFVEDVTRQVDKRLHFLKCNREKFDLLKLENEAGSEVNVHYLEVPCGSCIECRLKKSREWASRIVCEQLTSVNPSLFVTLTYDDDHLPIGRIGLPTLDIDVISKFYKDLRRYCQYHYGFDGLRHYTAAEYGTVSKRPHYHSCMFNVPHQILEANQPYKVSFNGDIYYNNPILEKIWNKGFVVVGDLTYQSAAYVARYVVKKLKGQESSVYSDLGIQSENARMSRKPGIGSSYFDLMKDKIYKYDALYLPKIGKVAPPSYFDRKFALDDPVVMELIKGDRALSAELRKNYILDNTDLDYDSYLKNEEFVLKERLKKLVRPL